MVRRVDIVASESGERVRNYMLFSWLVADVQLETLDIIRRSNQAKI